MAELQLISSDSHVSEPPDLWVERIDTKYRDRAPRAALHPDAHVSEPPDLWGERIDTKYRDRAPRVVLNPEGQEGAYLVYEGYPPHNLAIGLGAGRTPEELRSEE